MAKGEGFQNIYLAGFTDDTLGPMEAKLYPPEPGRYKVRWETDVLEGGKPRALVRTTWVVPPGLKFKPGSVYVHPR